MYNVLFRLVLVLISYDQALFFFSLADTFFKLLRGLNNGWKGCPEQLLEQNAITRALLLQKPVHFCLINLSFSPLLVTHGDGRFLYILTELCGDRASKQNALRTAVTLKEQSTKLCHAVNHACILGHPITKPE